MILLIFIKTVLRDQSIPKSSFLNRMASVEGGSGMALECAWPYWMSRPEGIIQSLVNDGASIHPCGAIANDVHMNDGMFILSGPNMMLEISMCHLASCPNAQCKMRNA